MVFTVVDGCSACWVAPAAGAAARVPAADAQAYPARPIQLVVPLGPAGINDIIRGRSRRKLSESWGEQVGGGIPARRHHRRAVGRGGVASTASTIPMVYSSHMVNSSLHASPSTTPWCKDAANHSGDVNLSSAVGAATPFKSAAELIAAARRPGQINCCTAAAPSSLGHLGGTALRPRSRHRHRLQCLTRAALKQLRRPGAAT